MIILKKIMWSSLFYRLFQLYDIVDVSLSWVHWIIVFLLLLASVFYNFEIQMGFTDRLAIVI